MAEEEIDFDDLQDEDISDDYEDEVKDADSEDISDEEYDEGDGIYNEEDVANNVSFTQQDTRFEPIELKIESRKTPDYLSKYELARVLGIRAEKIERGYPTTLRRRYTGKDFDPIKIAALEILEGVCPILIHRHLPSGRVEIRKVSDLRLFRGQIDNLLSIINRGKSNTGGVQQYHINRSS